MTISCAVPARVSPCLAILGLALALGACRAEPPPVEQRPEPQAHTGLRDAIQAPQQEAESSGQVLLDGADQQRARIEAAEGG
jgi:hypothetical protein